MEDIPRENIKFGKLLMSHIRMAAPHITSSTTKEEIEILEYFDKHGEAPTKDYLNEIRAQTSATPVTVDTHNIWELACYGMAILIVVIPVLIMVLKWQGRI